jgi:hypothetical protein
MNLANISFCFYGPFNEILILFSWNAKNWVIYRDTT